MSDLVKRLRDGCNLQQRDGERAADRIEQLEWELVEWKALADRLHASLFEHYVDEVSVRNVKAVGSMLEYHKSRGLR